jgi:hypothetical protein
MIGDRSVRQVALQGFVRGSISALLGSFAFTLAFFVLFVDQSWWGWGSFLVGYLFSVAFSLVPGAIGGIILAFRLRVRASRATLSSRDGWRTGLVIGALAGFAICVFEQIVFHENFSEWVRYSSVVVPIALLSGGLTGWWLDRS